MSIRDRYIYFAPWLAVLAFCAVTAIAYWSYTYSKGGQAERELHQTQWASYAAQQHSYEKCLRSDTIDRARECYQASSKSTRDQVRSEQDLNAQREMADWAEGMLIVTFFVGFLTVAAASAAAWFALGTVRETRRIGEAQTQSYVHINGAELFWGGMNADQPRISLRVVNVGQTPARWFEIVSRTHTVRLKEDGSLDIDRGFLDWPRENLSFSRWTSLGNSTEGLTVGACSRDESLMLREEYPKRHEIAVIVRGVVRYMTFFDDIYESEFCFFRRRPPEYIGKNVSEESSERLVGSGKSTVIVSTIDEQPISMQRSSLQLKAYVRSV